MTIALSDNTPRVSYTVAEGVTQTAFTVTFEFFDDADLNFYVDGTLKTLTTHYTVTGGDGSTGTINTTSGNSVTGIAGGSTVVITRSIAFARTTDFPSSGAFEVATLNTELDRFTAIAADINDDTDRSIHLADDDEAVSTQLPLKADRLGKVLGFNATTGAVEAGPTIADVSSLAQITADISTLADIEDGTDATDAIQTVAGISSNVTTVAGISANVTTVAGISSDVTAVVADQADIGTVASNISSVNTVATNIADVITVANDLNEAVSEVVTVADDLNEAVSEIDTVASSISNVDTVGTNIANVNTVAGNNANVTTVAGISANVTTVAGISGNVSTVAGISSDVTTVAADGTDIGTVATNITNVNTVAGISSNVTTVAGISANVTSVAGNATNINTVAGDSTAINAVASDATDIGTVATNIANVNTVAGISANVTTVAGDTANIGTLATNLNGTDTIGTVAGSISNVNSVGGSITNVNTVASNLSSVNSFADTYRIGATDPTTSLDTGDLFYNTTSSTLKVYTGSAWEQGVTAGSGFLATTGGGLTGDLTFGDSNKAIFGAGGDLQIYHDSNNSYIKDAGVGGLIVQASTSVSLQGTNTTNLATFFENGAATLYHSNSPKLATTSTGVDVTGVITTDGMTTSADINFGDNDKAVFGEGSDLQIYHDSVNSIISDQGTGDLIVYTNGQAFQVDSSSGENMIYAQKDAGIKLYHNNNEKLDVNASGVTITGTASATTFSGDLNGTINTATTATTQSAGDNTTKVATTAFVTTAVNNAEPFPSGTSMLFQQTAAPTGWTKQTTHNDKALRIVTGTVGTGGSSAFSTALATPSVAGGAVSGNPTSNLSVSISGNIANTTLSTSQIPSHSHELVVTADYGQTYVNLASVLKSQGNNTGTLYNGHNTNNTGGGGSHNHSHNLSGSMSGNVTAGNLAVGASTASINVNYVDFIIANKD